jgi:hypothetical protein
LLSSGLGVKTIVLLCLMGHQNIFIDLKFVTKPYYQDKYACLKRLKNPRILSLCREIFSAACSDSDRTPQRQRIWAQWWCRLETESQRQMSSFLPTWFAPLPVQVTASNVLFSLVASALLPAANVVLLSLVVCATSGPSHSGKCRPLFPRGACTTSGGKCRPLLPRGWTISGLNHRATYFSSLYTWFARHFRSQSQRQMLRPCSFFYHVRIARRRGLPENKKKFLYLKIADICANVVQKILYITLHSVLQSHFRYACATTG